MPRRAQTLDRVHRVFVARRDGREHVCGKRRPPRETLKGGRWRRRAARAHAQRLVVQQQRRLDGDARARDGARHSHLLRYVERGEGCVTGEHNRHVLRLAQRADDRGRILPHWASKREEASKGEATLDPRARLLGIHGRLGRRKALATASLVRQS